MTWPLCLQLERRLLTGAELFGASYDLSKAFDQLPFGHGGFLWQLVDKLCFPSHISNVMTDMYQNLTRRFKFNGYLGQPITSSEKRGALQGCAFSMVAMWLRWLGSMPSGKVFVWRAGIPQYLCLRPPAGDLQTVQNSFLTAGNVELRSGGYADDLHVAGASKEIKKQGGMTKQRKRRNEEEMKKQGDEETSKRGNEETKKRKPPPTQKPPEGDAAFGGGKGKKSKGKKAGQTNQAEEFLEG